MQEAVLKPVHKRRWFIVLSIVLLLAVVFLVVLPYGLSYGLNSWLRQNGGDNVSIDDVDFNVFTGRAKVENLQLSAGQRTLLTIPRLELDVDWLPLFSRQVVVRSAIINGVAIEIEQAEDGSLRVGGINMPEGDNAEEVEPGTTWHVGVDSLAIMGTSINFRSSDLNLDTRFDDLLLTGIKTWASEPAPLVFKGAINGAAVSLDGQLPPLASGVGYRGQVTLDGLDLAGFASLAGDVISGLAGRLSIDTQLDVLQAEGVPLTVTQSGTVSTRGLIFSQAANHIEVGDLSWQGDVELGVGDVVKVSANGKVNVAALDLGTAGSEVRLARIDTIDVGSIDLQDSGDVAIKALVLKGAVLAKEADSDAIVVIGGLNLDSVLLSGGDVALGKLEARDLIADLRRDSAGQWNVSRVIDSLPKADETVAAADTVAEADVATPAAEQDPGGISISSISITGDSAVALHDTSVKPLFKTRLTINTAEIGRIDSTVPLQDTPVDLKLRTSKHSRINIKGTVRPFAERPTLDFVNHFEGIALTELSPYIVSTLGYALKSGHLDADSTVKIDKGKMDIGNKLTIRGLEVTPVENASREKFDQQLPVPLGTALDMLRDKHDTIKLDLPVTGDIDNPDFDISDVINIAVGKAMKKGAKTYLLMALQPYGALISVAQLAGEAASRVRLDPVVFDAGVETRRADTDDYLEKVAGIMKDRPEINIKVCGLSSGQDRLVLSGSVSGPSTAGGRLPDTVLEPELTDKPATDAVQPVAGGVTDEQLLELAGKRAAAIIDFLVENYSINASRLVTCQPTIDSDADAQGRVDLLI